MNALADFGVMDAGEIWEKRLNAFEQEQSVLGAVLRLNRSLDQIYGLRVEDFHSGQHRLIYGAMLKMSNANLPIDVFTLHGHLQAQGRDVELTYLHALLQSMPSAANVTYYAGIVRDRSLKRGLLTAVDEVVKLVHQSPDDGAVLVDAARAKLEILGRVDTTSEPQLAIESLGGFLEQIDAEYNGAESPATSTGFVDLDQKLNGGFRPGQLVVLAARPKMGKTALALNIANYIAVHGVSAVLSMEMNKSELHARNVSSIGHIELEHISKPKMLTTEDWQAMTRTVQKLESMGLYIDDQGALSLLQVRGKAMSIKRQAGGRLDLLVIDYLQLMSGPGDNRNSQIEAITRGLKGLAKELGCAILLLSQLNRNLEQRPNKRPQPSDLRDSGSIEQDADIAMFLYRDEVYNEDSQDRGMAELNVALNRQGAAGRIFLTFRGQFTRFEDAARGYHPAPPRTPPAAPRGFTD